jgi:uncharacterized tellurite resistance protein B-like protein
MGFLDKFRRKVKVSVFKEPDKKEIFIDDKIALGVLLWVVAKADDKFLPEEESQIKETLIKYCNLKQDDLNLVLNAIKAAEKEAIDLYSFTSVISKDLNYGMKIAIVENLFRVACIDRDLDNSELETIRKISGLLGLEHAEFINTKIKIKREFGLETFDV